MSAQPPMKPEFTAAVTKQLKEMYERHGLKVAISETQADSRKTADWQFAIVIWMMLALSIIVALVGGLALMGALSIGVIERTKEIGVLRAVGHAHAPSSASLSWKVCCRGC